MSRRFKILQSVGYELKGRSRECDARMAADRQELGARLPQSRFGAVRLVHPTMTAASSSISQHDRTWVNSSAGLWRNELQVGSEQLVDTSFYQPLDVTQRFFVEPKAFWNRDWENVFYDGAQVARYRFDDGGGRVRRSA